jgi:hypothetical protein
MTAVEKWVSGYKVTYFPWIDGKRICLNIQYYKPGSSLYQPPAWELTVYLADNDESRDLLENHETSLIESVVRGYLLQNKKETEVTA